MRAFLPLLLLAACLVVSSCGASRNAPGHTPSQRYEYRTGRPAPAAQPAHEQKQKKSKKTARRDAGKKKDGGKPAGKGPEATSLKGHELIVYARKFLGRPYRYGADGPDRFDCSGFTSYVYRHFGIQLARNSGDQFAAGKPVRDISRLQPGDLVFFARKGKIFHVGMAVESAGDHFTFIHAGNSGVTISRSDETYWKPLYYGAKRMIE